MNKTKNNRWNRYGLVDGVRHKRCNGPLHIEGGELLPLRLFWIHKSGVREGKLFSRCRDCSRIDKGRTNSGYIHVDSVRKIFDEIEARLGRAEAARRLNSDTKLYIRLNSGKKMYFEKATVQRAMILLRELRMKDEVRHRDSIKHGAAARGHKEKIVMERKDLYKPHGDDNAEQKKAKRRATAGE